MLDCETNGINPLPRAVSDYANENPTRTTHLAQADFLLYRKRPIKWTHFN